MIEETINGGKKMKRFIISLVCAYSLSTTSLLYADAISEFETHSTKDAMAFIKMNKLEIVGFDYLKAIIQNGTKSDAKAILVDSRPQTKYDQGHIPSSLNLPDTKFDIMYENTLGTIPKDKELITYCGGYSCTKSHELALMLKSKGHTNVKIYAAGMPEWSLKSYDEISTITAKSYFETKKGLFIDSRPYGKFAAGTIIGSLNIPDTKLDEYLGWFPNDKTVVIIPYCGGYTCSKSHDIGNKLVSLGYKNIKVYAAGYPEWQEMGLATTNALLLNKETTQPSNEKKQLGFLKPGSDSGSVDGKWFSSVVASLPTNVLLIDVRDPNSFSKGHIKGAINIFAEKIKPTEFIKMLPKDKEIVFYCGSGTRAMEAREFAKEAKFEKIDSLMYFDANIECVHNECKIKPNEPIGF